MSASTVPLAEKPSEPTKAAPIRGALVGILAVLIFGIFSAAYPSNATLLWIVGGILFFGFLGGSRSGKCPNCGAGIFLRTGQTKRKCGECKHRVVLRNNRLIDVT